MKEKRIAIRGLYASLEKKYGDCELMGLISPYIQRAISEERSIALWGRPKYPRLFHIIGESVKNTYLTDPQAIAEAMGVNSLTYSELSRFYT